MGNNGKEDGTAWADVQLLLSTCFLHGWDATSLTVFYLLPQCAVTWNSLPAALQTATLSPLTFARHLKAHLFG